MKTIKYYYTQVYSSVRYKSKRRGEEYPSFTKKELIQWLISMGLQQMWITYAESGYNKDLKPSIDRLDDYGVYEFYNMRLVTWRENLIAGVNGKKHHKNCHNKQNEKAINLLTGSNIGITKVNFSSVKDCAKWLKVHPVSVSRVLTGMRKKIKGYKVEYA
jgi:hypothetical protein